MTPLHVVIDARELAGHVTGAGVYLLQMLRQWAGRDDVRLTLLSHAPLAPAVDAIPNLTAARVVRPDATGGTLWEQLVLPRAVGASGADVLFAPAYTAPLTTSLPVVLAVHDVSFAAHPEWYPQPGRLRRNFVSRRAAGRAAAVVTISDFSASEIRRHFGVPAGRLHVVPPGAPAKTPAFDDVRDREPLVTYVGSIFNRRHVPAMIAAVAALRRSDARLFIAGANRTWPYEDIAAHIEVAGGGSRITWREDAPDADIAAALARASASCWLSEYEGFAMTPFEGLASGVPPVVLDTPVAREVYGEAALYVDRPDPPPVAAALDRLIDSATLREDLVGRAAPLWSRFDWARSAATLLDVLREAAR